ncbi:MAG: porin [Candidatus Omnitrophica bacterium]|nr:porin [Candidatus Omnitrophota bacterium]
MKLRLWTIGLVTAGLLRPVGISHAEEAPIEVLSALSPTLLSGYVDTSAIWNLGSGNGGKGVGNPFSGGTFPGRSYDGTPKQDGFNLDVVSLTLGKPLDDSAWSAGYNVTLLFGPDAVGYNPSFQGSLADFSLKDTYVAMQVPLGNGLHFKLGNYSEVLGYEVFESGKNPNFSRSYGYFIEPTQLTGVLADYEFNSVITLVAGIANTWSSGLDARPTRLGVPAAESEKTYLGMITLTAPKGMGFLEGATLNAGIINGLGSGAASPASAITSYYLGGTVPTPIHGFSVGYAYDYRGTGQNGIYPSSYANATALYLLYQATGKLKFASRTEYASGSVDTWYIVSPVERHPRNELFGWTLTADYALWANVISRVEFRWDHDLTGQSDGNAIFGNGGRNAYSLALNVIYQF